MIRAAVIALLMTAGNVAGQVPEPDGFRGEPYRAPVPATLTGAQVIESDRALALHEQGVAFIDVYPRVKKPEGLPPGTVWRQPAHQTIPGAVWLWDTGYDRLAPAEQARLETGLTAATRGDKAAPVVIFCVADCWMGWNAAKRAVQMGYTGVTWFPEGTDGWLIAGGAPLVTVEPADP